MMTSSMTQQQFFNHLFQYQDRMQRLLMFSIIFNILIMGECEFLKLFLFRQQIDNQCLIIDTNNLTQIGMGNCQNQMYFINLGLGTPPQFANFLIDTFRYQIWFPLNQSFANSSQTFQISNKTAITYLQKNLYQGSIGSDIVSVLSTNISTRSSVVWANSTPTFSLYPQISGLVGLGYSSTPNFLDNAAQNGQINSSVFSLQMGGTTHPSILYYNQLPSFIIQNTIYVPVVGNGVWQVQVNNIRANGYDFSAIISPRMIIDSSTSMIYLNPLLYNALYSRFFSNACIVDTNGKSICPCSQDDYPNIQFFLKEVIINVEPSQYFVKEAGQCVLQLGQTLNEQNPLLIGTSLMKNYVITFDKENQQIGFNGQPISPWNDIFVILQLIMICVGMITLGVIIYAVATIRYFKKEKKQKKQKSGKQKLIQLTTAFLDQ